MVNQFIISVWWWCYARLFTIAKARYDEIHSWNVLQIQEESSPKRHLQNIVFGSYCSLTKKSLKQKIYNRTSAIICLS